jgi:hypothetical protein
MQDIPAVPTIKPPEVPADLGGGLSTSLGSLRDVLYSWWFWVLFLVFLAVVSWIIISRRRRGGY